MVVVREGTRITHNTRKKNTHHRRRRRRRAQSWCRTWRRSWRSRMSSSRGSCSSVLASCWSGLCVCAARFWYVCSVCMFFFVRVTHLANQTPAPLSSRSRPTLPCARVETINNAAISIAVAARQAWGARGGAALGGAIAARFGMRMCVPLSLNASRAVLPGAHGGSIECISSSLYARLLLRSVYVCWGEWSDTPRKSLRREK